MRSSTTTIETNISVDRLVDAFLTGTTCTGAALAVSTGGPKDAAGTAVSATGVTTGFAGAGMAAGLAAGF